MRTRVPRTRAVARGGLVSLVLSISDTDLNFARIFAAWRFVGPSPPPPPRCTAPPLRAAAVAALEPASPRDDG